MNSTPYKVTVINAIVLIALSAWGYLSVENSSFTALIPAIFGVIFLILAPAIKKHNKIAAHIVVVLTLLLIIALIKPLTGQLQKENMLGVARVSLMILSSLIALVVYIKSFIDARKAKG